MIIPSVHLELISQMKGHIMNSIRLLLASTVLTFAAHAAAEIVYIPSFPSDDHQLKAQSNSSTETLAQSQAE